MGKRTRQDDRIDIVHTLTAKVHCEVAALNVRSAAAGLKRILRKLRTVDTDSGTGLVSARAEKDRLYIELRVGKRVTVAIALGLDPEQFRDAEVSIHSVVSAG